MSRVAIFVDAGYLFAQGSVALTGAKKSRSLLSLDESAVIAELITAAFSKCDDAKLLRIYWYDGALGSKALTSEHAILANTDHVKLRLGFMNSQVQQKGVDSLIVTDLIELARNGAIGDALLLSGDEDVRVGVQIAQSFGVRVHLLGIIPSRGSQSVQLLQEADTKTEWDAATVKKFLTVKATTQVSVAATPSPAAPVAVSATASISSHIELTQLEKVADEVANGLDSHAVANLHAYWTTERGIPSDIDGRLLATCRSEIGRDLQQHEKHHLRRRFISAVKSVPEKN